MRVSRRRLHRREAVAELNVTAFMNLMVVLVPFLLITAVFSRLAILELSLPVASDEPVEQQDKIEQLQIFVLADAVEVADESGLIQRFETNGSPINYKAINELLKTVKTKQPERDTITLLFEPETPYDIIVQMMDTARETLVIRNGIAIRAELFPGIAIGDAVVGAAPVNATDSNPPAPFNNNAEQPSISGSPSLGNRGGNN